MLPYPFSFTLPYHTWATWGHTRTHTTNQWPLTIEIIPRKLALHDVVAQHGRDLLGVLDGGLGRLGVWCQCRLFAEALLDGSPSGMEDSLIS